MREEGGRKEGRKGWGWGEKRREEGGREEGRKEVATPGAAAKRRMTL